MIRTTGCKEEREVTCVGASPCRCVSFYHSTSKESELAASKNVENLLLDPKQTTSIFGKLAPTQWFLNEGGNVFSAPLGKMCSSRITPPLMEFQMPTPDGEILIVQASSFFDGFILLQSATKKKCPKCFAGNESNSAACIWLFPPDFSVSWRFHWKILPESRPFWNQHFPKGKVWRVRLDQQNPSFELGKLLYVTFSNVPSGRMPPVENAQSI